MLAIGLKDADPEAQSRTLRLLSRRGECYGRAEPVLIAHLKSANADIAENAAICLKNYGAQAFNALPHLQTALTRADPGVRAAASNAIYRITALDREQSIRH